MTRINCIPPAELTRQHLVAEYRELPRVVALANAAWPRRAALALPADYRLGTGHVLFFYDKLSWLQRRFGALVDEMKRRGYRPQFDRLPQSVVGDEWQRDWTPSAAAMAINRQRIAERTAK